MSRTQRFLGGLSLGLCYQVLVMLAGLWLTPFLLHRLGEYEYGLWLVGLQLVLYLWLVDFGVLALLPRETAYATGQAGGVADPADLAPIIGRDTRLLFAQVPVVALAALVLYGSMPAGWEPLSRPLGLVLIAFVLVLPLRVYHAVLQGLQDLTFLGWVQLGGWFVSIFLSVGLVLAGWGLYALAAGWIAGQVLSAGAWWYRFRRLLPGIRLTRWPAWDWPSARAQLLKGFWISLSQIAQILLSGTDLVLVGILFGPEAAVPYACTAKLISILANQPQLVMQVAQPALSEMKGGESPQRLFAVITALSQTMLMVSGAVVCLVLLVNQGFVGWWVGANQYGGFWLSLLLLVSMLLRHWNVTVISTIFCFGYEKRISLTAILDGLLTVGSSVLFLWLFGPFGAPLGSILGACLVSLPVNLTAMAREAGVSRTTLVLALWPWFWRFLLLVGGAVVLAQVWVPHTFLTLTATAGLAALIYAGVMLPTALRSPLGHYLRAALAPFREKFFRSSLADAVDA